MNSNQILKKQTWICQKCKSSLQLNCRYVSRRINSLNLRGVQVTESSKTKSLVEILGIKKLYELHLLHFLIQRVLLLASQEDIFIRTQYFSYRKVSVNWRQQVLWFGHQWNKGGEGKVSGGGRGLGGRGVCSLCSQNASGLTLKKKPQPLIIELVVVLNHFVVVHCVLV